MTAGFLIRKANYMTPKQMNRSLRSLQLYLQGYTWPQIHAKGGYSWPIFTQMMAAYPDLSKSYQEARKTSGQTFEDKALALADKLAGKNEYTGTGVRAVEVAMNQYRWSATRRDPAAYAEAGANKVSVIVPVQINSSLNLAQPGAKDEETISTAYEVHGEVLAREPKDEREELEVEDDPQEPSSLSSGLPADLEVLREAVGLPVEVPKVIKKHPSPGRTPKRHKSHQVEGLTKLAYATKKKSPAVRRALGLKEQPNGNTEHDGDELTGNGVWSKLKPV